MKHTVVFGLILFLYSAVVCAGAGWSEYNFVITNNSTTPVYFHPGKPERSNYPGCLSCDTFNPNFVLLTSNQSTTVELYCFDDKSACSNTYYYTLPVYLHTPPHTVIGTIQVACPAPIDGNGCN